MLRALGVHLRIVSLGRQSMKRSSRISTVRFLLTLMLLNGLAWGTVTVSPKHAAIVVSTQTQQFTSSDANVTWSVDDVAGGSALVGRSPPLASTHPQPLQA